MKILYKPHYYSQQRQHEKKAKIYPVRMAMEAQWYRNMGHTVYWDEAAPESVDRQIVEPEGLPFLSLPQPDRVFTYAKEYTSGNYKHLPGTHIMAASGCWWGKCEFCVEKGKKYEVRPVKDVIAEIAECKRLGFREIFDDSDTFPAGDWRLEFCRQLRPLDITFSCNMRFGTLKDNDFLCLKYSGFRMLLYGLESANQFTLDRINKGINVNDALDELVKASSYGLEPHIAVMFGYPWETDQDAEHTLKVVQFLLRKGFAKTAQASFYRPQLMKDGDKAHKKYIKRIYHAGFYPDFWINKIIDIRSIDDIRYIWRGIKSWLGR